jgi:16S rRNA G966 N2-methylase RsmD
MRVVAGSAAGRRLEAPPGTATRPTGDRVREATFNSLGSLGLVQDATLIDVFAGSGALGIEALSRGAESVTFLERDPRAVRVIKANLATVGLAERAEVVRGDALAYLASLSGAGTWRCSTRRIAGTDGTGWLAAGGGAVVDTMSRRNRPGLEAAAVPTLRRHLSMLSSDQPSGAYLITSARSLARSVPGGA